MSSTSNASTQPSTSTAQPRPSKALLKSARRNRPFLPLSVNAQPLIIDWSSSGSSYSSSSSSSLSDNDNENDNESATASTSTTTTTLPSLAAVSKRHWRRRPLSSHSHSKPFNASTSAAKMSNHAHPPAAKLTAIEWELKRLQALIQQRELQRQQQSGMTLLVSVILVFLLFPSSRSITCYLFLSFFNSSSTLFLLFFYPSSYLVLPFFFPSSYLVLLFFYPSSYLVLLFFYPSSHLVLPFLCTSSTLLLLFFYSSSTLLLILLYPSSAFFFSLNGDRSFKAIDKRGQ
jgi:hypothetical protein